MTTVEPWLWTAAALVSAALAIWGRPPARRLVHYVCKPLTLLLIMGLLLRLAPAGAARLHLVLAALALSVVGDVLLMLPAKGFAAGLFAFLGALVLYGLGFAREVVWSPHVLLAILPGLVLGQWVLRTLWPHLGRLRAPVVIYVAVLVAMSACALARLASPAIPFASALTGAAGALLFMLGDALLALRRFARLAAPYALELGAYFAAQWALAATVWLVV